MKRNKDKNYLEKISAKYLDELYSKVDDKDRSISKEENVYTRIMLNSMSKILDLNREEVEQINKIMNNEEVENISDRVKDYYVFYDPYGDKEYYITDNVKRVVSNIPYDSMNRIKQELGIIFYVEANGVITVKKLHELLERSKIKNTTRELRELLFHSDYIIENDIIYVNEVVYESNLGKYLLEVKRKRKYKTFTPSEMNMILPIIIESEEEREIRKIISKKIKRKTIVNYIVEEILTIFRSYLDYGEEINYLLEENEILLTQKESERLYKILKSCEKKYPHWALNGKKKYELIGYNVRLLPVEEKIAVYIRAYMSINGPIPLENMVEILSSHGIELTKKELIGIIKAMNGVSIYKNNIYFGVREDAVRPFLEEKLDIPYKKIDNVAKLLKTIPKQKKEIEDLCCQYGFPQKIGESMYAYMLYGHMDKESINEFFISKYGMLPKPIFESLYPKLQEKFQDINCWKYNGHTQRELDSFQNHQKVKN